MFGMPDGASLSKVVFELCRVHPRTVGDQHGLEAPLLQMLEGAIASDTSGAYGGGSSRTGAPVDLGALKLWQGISAVVGEHWPGRGDLAQAKVHLIPRLEAWVGSLAGTDDEVYLLDLCWTWHEAIRHLLEPPKEVPLRGVSCPSCKQDRVLLENSDREYVYQPPLMAYLSEMPVRVTCRGCAATWFGDDMNYIAAAMEFDRV